MSNELKSASSVKTGKKFSEKRNNIGFTIEVDPERGEKMEPVRNAAERAVMAIPGVLSVSAVLTAQTTANQSAKSPAPPHSGQQQAVKLLEDIGAVIAVASGKGGVGKSTTSVNLALAFAQKGLRTAILDADIYGPSLATMVALGDEEPSVKDDMIQPFEKDGVKLMSFAYVVDKESEREPAAMRGPMVTQVITQLLTGTLWGELDYLIIDYPPGTGDVQLTIAQLVPATASVIVTTPQTLSFIDVEKGILLFDKLAVPTLAVVENMSYFTPPGSTEQLRPFGQGASKRLKENYGFEKSYELAIFPELSEAGDSGRPLVLSHPDHDASSCFDTMAADLMTTLAQEEFLSPDDDIAWELISDDGSKLGFLRSKSSPSEKIAFLKLRLACESANNEIRQDLEQGATCPEPLSLRRVGNYAIGIDWSDGHHSIFPRNFGLRRRRAAAARWEDRTRRPARRT